MTLSRRAALAALGTSAAALSGCLGSLGQSASPCPATVRAGAEARLGLTGDVMLGRSVDERWASGPDDAQPSGAGASQGVWGSTLDALDSFDGTFVNLECCVSDRGERRPGRTYHFRAGPDWAVPALDAAGVAWASLANNHVLDYGPAAFADTLDHLGAGGIAHAGAGADLDAALEPSVVTVGGLTVAVVGFTDQSPSYGAGPDSPGTAFVRCDPLDPRTRELVGTALDRARAADPDLVVASLHWGPNWEVVPSDTQQRFARWLVDSGVDVVHGHSAHVLQGVETYRGRPILYDCGDFVDDYVVKPDLHNDRSALFELVVADGRLDALRVHPVRIDRSAVRDADAGTAAWVRDRLRSLSEPFGTTVVRDGDGLRVPLAGTCSPGD